jgi:hypothetical protein
MYYVFNQAHTFAKCRPIHSKVRYRRFCFVRAAWYSFIFLRPHPPFYYHRGESKPNSFRSQVIWLYSIPPPASPPRAFLFISPLYHLSPLSSLLTLSSFFSRLSFSPLPSLPPPRYTRGRSAGARSRSLSPSPSLLPFISFYPPLSLSKCLPPSPSLCLSSLSPLPHCIPTTPAHRPPQLLFAWGVAWPGLRGGGGGGRRGGGGEEEERGEGTREEVGRGRGLRGRLGGGRRRGGARQGSHPPQLQEITVEDRPIIYLLYTYYICNVCRQ